MADDVQQEMVECFDGSKTIAGSEKLDGTGSMGGLATPEKSAGQVNMETESVLAPDGTSMDVPEQVMRVEDSSSDVVEPLTPATDKSPSESGRVTPASQSDQSAYLSSSEKSTTSHKSKITDPPTRQIEFDAASTSSGSVKNEGSKKVPQRQGLQCRKGEKIEAMDYLHQWFPAKIRAVNEEDAKVLVHFDGWNQRYDEWITMNSDRIRPLIRHSERKEKSKRVKTCPVFLQDHTIGDQVYAKWTDCKMYPAKITNILPSGSYEVIFYDGFKKLVQPINVRSMPGESKQSFEIEPVPEPVLKKAKMKLDVVPDVPKERSRSLSGEKTKFELTQELLEKKKCAKPRRKRQTFDGADLASIVNSLEQPAPEQVPVHGEPIATQTDYTKGEDQADPALAGSDISVAGVGKSGSAILPPKAFVVEQDHNPYKCHFEGCNKSFRKAHLLDYHIKYYHMTEGDPPLPPKKKRRKTTSTCSTESEQGTSCFKKSVVKKNRNLSTEGTLYQPTVKLEVPDVAAPPTTQDTEDTGIQTSPVKHPDSYTSEDSNLGVKMEIKAETQSLEDSSVTDAEDFLKPDELVNCICDFQEENGLMIQCEVCMCWQHAACFGITERTLPKTYVCFVCENPPGVRESAKYIHEQDWFKTGEIPSLSYLPRAGMSEEKCSTVKTTHTLVADIHHLNTVLYSLKLQLKILRTKDETKLRQWRLDWDVMDPLQETIETCPKGGDNYTIVQIKREDNSDLIDPSKGLNSDVKTEIKSDNKIELVEVKKEPVSSADESEVENSSVNVTMGNSGGCVRPRPESGENGLTVNTRPEPSSNGDQEFQRNDTSGSCSANGDVLTVESQPKGSTLPTNSQDVPESSTNTSLQNDKPGGSLQQTTGATQGVEEDIGTHSDSTESVIEDPVEVCEKNLLSHILRVQGEISDRLDRIEEEVTMLEAMDAVQSRRQPAHPQTVLSDLPLLKQNMKTLHTDLTKVKKMSVFHYQV
ncbi:PHD finger protein 20-like protein 1 isoform X2 [Mya arenaria]|uniref:PHD finger protein 20-like protein 1 isoform X2 n=1 Tax=Mya arenaria TaxID=6604 RepID=UPI0022E325C2|nr:PHD finger protein 20-like protein 1 isoform X2 [Mya arenaria]